MARAYGPRSHGLKRRILAVDNDAKPELNHSRRDESMLRSLALLLNTPHRPPFHPLISPQQQRHAGDDQDHAERFARGGALAEGKARHELRE